MSLPARHALHVFLPCAALLMGSGCDSPKGAEAKPPVPAQLVAHDELPFGDRASARITRASNRVRDGLEPQWGPLESRIYTLPVKDRDAVLRDWQVNVPPGWETVPVSPAIPADTGTVRAFAKDRQIYALLLVEVTPSSPVMAGVLFRGEGRH